VHSGGGCGTAAHFRRDLKPVQGLPALGWRSHAGIGLYKNGGKLPWRIYPVGGTTISGGQWPFCGFLAFL